ncbi:MAG TPA: GlsB/YeaQ/YmgE family stress response membrane protein [Candidatus Methylomirabilis sp.]|nr:GlsB/YeaQ/YmgE family stress response membrane protein [Candidatus Methylomirabilis sp.]
MIHMIGHAIFGLIIGLLARAVMPGGQRMGLILTMILGLVGAWLGGLIGRMTGMYREGHPAGFIMALIGALIVLFVYSRFVVA